MDNKDAMYFKKLAKQLMFELNDQEASEMVQEFEEFNHLLVHLASIDTTGVEEMIYPFEEPVTYLREDELIHVITQQEALSNVSNSQQGHFVVPKVVK